MASNQLSNDQNDIDGQSKIALITGITGQVEKIIYVFEILYLIII